MKFHRDTVMHNLGDISCIDKNRNKLEWVSSALNTFYDKGESLALTQGRNKLTPKLFSQGLLQMGFSTTFQHETSRKCMYKGNTKARPRNQCCFGKAKSVTSYMCFYTELSSNKANVVYFIVICYLFRLYKFFHII